MEIEILSKTGNVYWLSSNVEAEPLEEVKKLERLFQEDATHLCLEQQGKSILKKNEGNIKFLLLAASEIKSIVVK